MRVTINDVELAGDGKNGVAEIRHAGDFVDQPETFTNGAEIEVFNRGNQSNVFTIEVSREHATFEDAINHIVIMATKAQTVGIIKFRAAGQAWYAKGSCKITEQYTIGRTTIHKFKLLTGIIRNTEITAI